MAYADLSTRKTMARLSSSLNESASDASHLQKSSFARRQLEKMGWSEGTGLGKNRDGMVAHIRTKKREESVGLGGEKKVVEEQSDMWWRDSVGSTLARLQQQKRQKERKRRRSDVGSGGGSGSDDGDDNDEKIPNTKKKRKKEKKAKKKKSRKERKKKRAKDASNGSEGSGGEIKIYSDHELFAATGGARFGMRAQRRAEAKWARTESGSKLWEEEKVAKEKIEWNGLGAAKLVLRKNGEGTGSDTSSHDKGTKRSGEDYEIQDDTGRKKEESSKKRTKADTGADTGVDVDGKDKERQRRNKKKEKKSKKKRRKD